MVLWQPTAKGNKAVTSLGGAGLWKPRCPPFALDFSPDGARLLCCARADPEGRGFTATVFDVATRQVVFNYTTSSLGTVFDAKW